MNANVDINIKEYDTNNWFLVVKRNNENLFMDLGICQFAEEMEYWDMPLKPNQSNDELGFIISKEIDIEDVKMEIERFIVHNNI